MRVLLVCALYAVSAYAAPQYSYGNSGILLGGAGIGVGAPALAPSLASGFGNGISGGLGNSLNHGSGRGGDKYLPPEAEQEAPIVHKQFYSISAQEEHSSKSKHLVIGKPQKNYRVIFIKAPHQDTVKYSAEVAPQEEKTVIYVLHKKSEDIDAANIATPAPTVPSKPEIFFIKYKTPEEAQQAQKEIQDQYDQLGGTNEFSESVGPVSSVVGSLDSLNSDGSYNYRQVNGVSSAPAPQPQQPHQLHQPHQPHQPAAQYLPSFLSF